MLEHTLRRTEKANFYAPPTVPALNAFDIELHAVLSSCFSLLDSLCDSFMTNKKNALPNEGPVWMDNNWGQLWSNSVIASNLISSVV